MPWLRIAFLITVLTVTSGYRWRCYVACTDQTSTQNDYTEQRDKCREYAQLKVDMAMREAGATDDMTRKTQLVSLFSKCMNTNGWIVPDGRGEGSGKKADAAAPAAIGPVAPNTPPPPTPEMIAADKKQQKAEMMRTSECAFARYNADVSSIAATRAHACDVECENALRASPGAPRPPSCPADVSPRLAKGAEK